MKNLENVIQRMIDTAPSQWVDMFQHHGLGKKPRVSKLIEKVLEKTASGASSGARGEAKYTVPRKVKQEAFEGLLLAHKHNWSSTSGIGLVRAMQLVLHPKIWERSVKRMHSYFTRHRNNRNSKAIKTGKKTWGPKNPTRGYIAHMAWGGDSGEKWASKQVKRINPKVSERLLTNPYLPLQNKKNALVPKEMVTLVGFDSDKTRQVEEEIPFVLGFIEQMRGESLVFPTPIRAMTVDEFNNGRNIVDSGHPMGAGHGQINLNTFDIAINPMMDVFDIVTNVFHENLHYAFPHWEEETVRDATGLAMENLYGVFNLGRPFAEERNKGVLNEK